MMEPRFGEVLTAMVTPFHQDGSLDLDGARSLTDHLIEHGSEGLVVCGTTGESPTLSHEEKMSLFETVVAQANGRAKVIAGTGTYNTAESIELTTEAAARGVDACLVVTPYYSKPPQNGLIAHFSAIADASPVPLMLYDIPGRTSRRIERPTMLTLAEHDQIVAVKDAVGDAGETAKLRGELDARGLEDFEIYSGDDPLLLPHLAAGAVGIVSVCSHLVGPQIKQIFSAWADGKVSEAQRIFLSLQPLFATIMTLTASPIPVKAALNMIGIEVGPPRLPLVDATPDEAAAIGSALEVAGIL
ncbi:MAG TPA: 4-hydroxy-tetrahydrodipicolinate synthase [Actinomycetota bacterium]|nr:4-hydroxy-tetrahydrodipicolinate synthase [Actinomycetota bacterium]